MDDRVTKLLEDPRKIEAIETKFKIPFALVKLLVLYSNLMDEKTLSEEEEAFIKTLEDYLDKLTNEYVGLQGRSATHLMYTVDAETGQVVSVVPTIEGLPIDN